VMEIIGRGETTPPRHIPFTPRAKKVLELSLREALHLGHNYIGTEHILLGLLREGEGAAAQVLQRLGADLGRVRQQVLQLLSSRTAGAPAARPIRLLEHLTDAALLGLIAARGEARRLGVDTVEVGPLFVGMLSVEDGAAGRALAEVVGPPAGAGEEGLDAVDASGPLDRLRAALGTPAAQTGDAPADAAPLPLSDSAQHVMTAAVGYAIGPIGTGHILAALLTEDAIADLLGAAGIDVSGIRDRVDGLRGSAGLP